jgi:hypothetical protein
MVYAGDKFNGIDGFSNDDAAQQNDQATQYQAVDVFVAGLINADLAAGETVEANAPVYPVPGTGRVSPTLVNLDGRQMYAVEDQATAAGRVGVIL